MTAAPLDESTRSISRRYCVAVLVTVVATGLKFLLPDLIGRDAPVAVYLGAVMLAAWYGGTGPGLLATLLFVLAGSYWFAAPYDSIHVADVHDAVRLFLGAAEGTVIALLAGALHRATLTANRRTDELRAANDVLRSEIVARAKAESSLERTSEQLVHAQKMHAIGTLAGGVAHDFNNLLSIILNYIALMLARLPAGDPLRQHVEEMRETGNRAANLTRGLLAFTRKGVVAPRNLDLRETVRDLDAVLRMILGDGIELSSRLGSTPARVHVDPTQMEQVLTNLAVNARDAMPHGGRLVIEIADAALDAESARVLGVPEGDYVCLVVEDTGQGIPDALRERVFEPLFTTKEAGRGSGLGLAIVRSVILGAGGAIGVESSPGAGTTFRVHLPRVDRGAVDEAPGDDLVASPTRESPGRTRDTRRTGVTPERTGHPPR